MSSLHVPTLLLADIAVILLCALLMLYSWWRGRHERTLLWLSLMLFLEGAGLLFNTQRGQGMDWLPIIAGNMLLLAGSGVIWAAMRSFCGRRIRWPVVLLGATIWPLLCLWPTFYGTLDLRVKMLTLLLVGYTLAAIFELWRGRLMWRVSTMAAQALMAAHALFYMVRALLGPWPAVDNSAPNPMQVAILLEAVLYAVGMSFLVLSMVKERAEGQYRAAALTDPLTGVGNRRAFLDTGERLLRQCAGQGLPVSLLLCDLDHFKAVNDRLGHAEGDRVLQAFTAGVLRRLRKSDVFGRIGGEEFACLMYGQLGEALSLAERIRAEFAAAGAQSVSIGVASSSSAGYDLRELLAQADAALYQAKGAGRDRVASFVDQQTPRASHSR